MSYERPTLSSVATTTEAPNTAALELQEALASRPTAMQDDGTVLIHVIRPTIGQGLGRHQYTADMLRENAQVFTGWKMYIDHQSPEARKAAGGLPRSIRDLGGRILESWWDDSVPAEGRFGQGAVVARVKPVGQVKALIEDDPELLEASIRAKATDVHPTEIEGEQVWVVEGIRENPPGSVDWVSEGGAGGRVADLIEGLVAESDEPVNEPAEGGDTVKELEEALRDPNSGASKAVRELVAERTAAAIKKQAERHQQELEEARTAALEEGRKEALEEAQKEAEEKAADAIRQIELRDLRDEAHKLISEAALPSKAEAKLMSEYSLDGSTPAPKLDITGSEDKSAVDALKESVESDIREARELLAEVMPTKVEGQGPSDSDGEVAPAPVDKPFYQEFLEEAGIDPEQAYGNNNKESV